MFIYLNHSLCDLIIAPSHNVISVLFRWIMQSYTGFYYNYNQSLNSITNTLNNIINVCIEMDQELFWLLSRGTVGEHEQQVSGHSAGVSWRPVGNSVPQQLGYRRWFSAL